MTNGLDFADPFGEKGHRLINLTDHLIPAGANPQEVKDLMLFGMISLLLDKGIISEEELTGKVEEATTFYKILKTRKEKQKDLANPES